MNDRAIWFVHTQPHAGKIRARPVHPIGWALLLGLPLPGLAAGAVTAGPGHHRLAGLAAALAVTGVALWYVFRVVRIRGRFEP